MINECLVDQNDFDRIYSIRSSYSTESMIQSWNHIFVAKKKANFSSFCGLNQWVWALWASVSHSGENSPRDAEKMNNDVLNIKDEGVAQQLFLFIFHWKHLDTSIHLFMGPTPSSFSPSLSFNKSHSVHLPLTQFV